MILEDAKELLQKYIAGQESSEELGQLQDALAVIFQELEVVNIDRQQQLLTQIKKDLSDQASVLPVVDMGIKTGYLYSIKLLDKYIEEGKERMEIIYKGRQQGKTAELIQRSAQTNTYIVVRSAQDAQRINKMALAMGFNIQYPITVEEIKRTHWQGTHIKKILVDDAERVLQAFIGPVEIAALTLTDMKGEQDEYSQTLRGNT